VQEQPGSGGSRVNNIEDMHHRGTEEEEKTAGYNEKNNYYLLIKQCSLLLFLCASVVQSLRRGTL
jgi:hypothetical protein